MVKTVYRIADAPCIALLADLHGRDGHEALSFLGAHKPSVICIAGDVLYGTFPVNDVSPLVTQAEVLPFLSACSAIAPTFLSLGNHEWMLDEMDLRSIAKTGVSVLDNDFATVKAEGRELVLGGLSSAYVNKYRAYRATVNAGNRYPRKQIQDSEKRRRRKKQDSQKPALIPDTSWLETFSAVSGYHILLSHHPEYIRYIPSSVELMLSGHAHGGQWRFYHPLKREWVGTYAPGQGWWPKLTSGVHDNRLVISRGLTNTAGVPRINNEPEIVFIEPA